MKKFLKFHGNYCGYGSKGGEPIDCLDEACMIHDKDYEQAQSSEVPSIIKRRADYSFINRTYIIIRRIDISYRLRFKAFLAHWYFRIKCRDF